MVAGASALWLQIKVQRLPPFPLDPFAGEDTVHRQLAAIVDVLQRIKLWATENLSANPLRARADVFDEDGFDSEDDTGAMCTIGPPPMCCRASLSLHLHPPPLHQHPRTPPRTWQPRRDWDPHCCSPPWTGPTALKLVEVRSVRAGAAGGPASPLHPHCARSVTRVFDSVSSCGAAQCLHRRGGAGAHSRRRVHAGDTPSL